MSSSPLYAEEIHVGSGTVDLEKIQGQRWVRVNFDPVFSGIHTVRTTWDSDADIRFSVFQIVDSPSGKLRIGTTVDSATAEQWSGTLDISEKYYLGIWAVTGSGNYTVTIEAEGVISTPPEIISQPVNLAVNAGEEAVFEVVANGVGALNYQWFLNDVAIVDATASTLQLSSVNIADDLNVYHVEVSDVNGSVSSDSAFLEVFGIALPVTVASMGQGILDSEKRVGPRWKRIDFDALANGLHIIAVSWDSGADVRYNLFEDDGTPVSPVIAGVNPGIWSAQLDVGKQYYIGVWSASGIANYTVTVEANVPVAIVSQPADRLVTEGDDATFTVEATGSRPFSYQWYADGQPIAGETTDTLTVFSTSLAEHEIQYSVDVTNGSDIATSDSAKLSVNERLVLGQYSQEADTSAWMLAGPAPTLDYESGVASDAFGRVLLQIGDILLVGGDFEGVKRQRNGKVTSQPFLAALNAVTGQPVSSFEVPAEVNAVVRTLVIAPNGNQIYVGGDFGLVVLDAQTGDLEFSLSVTKSNSSGRVFDIAVTETQLYIGGDFTHVNNVYRANIARLSLDGTLDTAWSPKVTHGFAAGRSAPVMSLAVSASENTVFVGGNFRFINNIPVSTTPTNGRISMLSLSAVDGSVLAERFIPTIGSNRKGLNALDIAVTEFYVIIAWGGPNVLSFHSHAGDLLHQYNAKGDVQALQVVGDHVVVGHHGEYFGSFADPVPQEAIESLSPTTIKPFKLHTFRIDDPSFLPEEAWAISGAFGIWGIAASEDSIWVAGQIFKAGSNNRPVDGLARFPAID